MSALPSVMPHVHCFVLCALASADGGSSGGMGEALTPWLAEVLPQLSIPCLMDGFVWLGFLFSTFQHFTAYMYTQPTPTFTLTFIDFHTPLILYLCFLLK